MIRVDSLRIPGFIATVRAPVSCVFLRRAQRRQSRSHYDHHYSLGHLHFTVTVPRPSSTSNPARPTAIGKSLA
jgi:hypothetical protein